MPAPRRAAGEAAPERNNNHATRRGDDATPKVGAWRGPDPSLFYVWCTFCRRLHTHGAMGGHRYAHCHDSSSPYQETGYYLVDTGRTLTAREVRQDRPDGTPARGGPAGGTTVYRCYDGTGQLLYVGVAAGWPSRLRQHQRDSTWFESVANVALERWATRDEALRAEVAAIKAEHPQFNITHARRRA